MNRQTTRPMLADLWRVLLAQLEDQGSRDAPAHARRLAINAWIGWDAETEGQQDDHVLIAEQVGSNRGSTRRAARTRRRPLVVR
jgi:hypothetical protein